MVAGDSGMSEDDGRAARSPDCDVGVAFHGEYYTEY